MNKIPESLKKEICDSEKINNIIGELQDIQGLLENSELISRLDKVIKEIQNV